MLQSPYFFFDVVYLHNGVEEQGDETSWRVSEPATGSLMIRFYLDYLHVLVCFSHSLMEELLLRLLHETLVFIGSQIWKRMYYKNTLDLFSQDQCFSDGD